MPDDEKIAMRFPTEGLQAAAEGLERLSDVDRARVVDVLCDYQRALAGIPGTATFKSNDDSEFFCSLADRIGDARFEALLSDIELDEKVRDSLREEAEQEGGIASLFQSRIERKLVFEGNIVCCVSGAIVAVGGAALALDAVATVDVPLAVLGGALLGAGGAAVILCC